jgi:hypothetical protein
LVICGFPTANQLLVSDPHARNMHMDHQPSHQQGSACVCSAQANPIPLGPEQSHGIYI